MCSENDFTINYINLANAIIIKASKDYRSVLKKLKITPEVYSLIKEKRKIEKFFCSEYCNCLTGVDGKIVLERLQRGE